MTENDPFLKELQQRADRAHKSADRADDAPPELWQRVRSQVNSVEEENPAMSALTMPASSAQLSQPVAPVKSRGIGHYANFAATITIVVGVALAGWFATIQINQPSPGNPQFAALGVDQEEAGNGVCDVEPLSVDDAITIMRDPMDYLSGDMDEDLVDPFEGNGLNGNYVAIGDYGNWQFLISLIGIASTPVIEREFDELLPIAHEYFDCVVHGSNGQVYRLLDPVVVQSRLVLTLPVLISEDEVRERLEVMFAEPALSPDSSLQREIVGVPNDDPELSIYIASGHLLHNGGAYIVPLKWVDSAGAVVAETDIYGNEVSGDIDQANMTFNIVMAKSNLDGNWYVSGTYNPHYYPVDED